MQNFLNALDDNSPIGLVVLDQNSTIKHMNLCMARWTTGVAEQAIGRHFLTIFPDVDSAAFASMLARDDTRAAPPRGSEDGPVEVEIRLGRGCGQTARLLSLLCFSFSGGDWGLCHALLFYDPDETDGFHRGFALTIRRLQAVQLEKHRLQKKFERTNNHLLQSEKLAGIGQLAAGVAHEINNPIGYVFSNLRTLAGYMQDLLKITDAVDTAKSLEELRQLKQNLEYGYIRRDVEALIDESEEGIGRVKKIITALKDFSHIDEETFRPVDLHRGIETTLNVANNEIKYKAKVVKEYGNLPEVECNASQINQVVMNLLVNAAQSISGFGTITIRSGHEDQWVWLEVEDTGRGMDAGMVKKIFDPFFTTKPLGQGTGLGLSLSYSIVQKHQGHIEVVSQPGEGARFRVWLPVIHTELTDL